MSDKTKSFNGFAKDFENNRNKNNNASSQNKIYFEDNPITFKAIGLSPAPYIILGLILAIATGFAVNYTSSYPPLLIIGGAIGLILIVSVIQKPELGGYILIFSVFTNLSDLFTEKNLPSINKPLVAIVLLSVFINYILRTGKIRTIPNFTRIEFLLSIYFISVLVSSFFAVNQSKSLSAIFDLTKDVAVGYCIYITLDTKEKVKTGLNILIGALTFASALGVIRTITGSSNNFWGFAQLSAFGQVSDTDGQLRYAGPIGESNIWGQVLVSGIPIILYKLASNRSILKKITLSLCGFLIALAMLFTESRGAFLAMFFITVLITIIDLRIQSKTFLAIVTSILLLLLVLPSKYTERITSLDVLFQNQEYGLTKDESINGRQAKMLTGLAMFAKNPFFGVGFANYSDNYWLYAGNLGLDSTILSVGTETEGEEQQPHSLYIEIMAETGIFGITSFLGFIGIILLSLKNSRKLTSTTKTFFNQDWNLMTSAIMMSIISFLIAGFFLHGIGFRFIWVLIGIALAFIFQSQLHTNMKKNKSV